MTEKHIRHGIGAVRPYLYGLLELADLVRHAFGAVEIERLEYGPHEFHVEARIGDSVVVLEIGGQAPGDATCASIYVYVEDVDTTYQRALERGAISIAEPQEKPYSERQAGVKDSFGNVWWISTFKNSATES